MLKYYFTCVWLAAAVGDGFAAAVGVAVVTVAAAVAVIVVVVAVAVVHLAVLCKCSPERVLVYYDGYCVAHEPAIHSPVMHSRDKARSPSDVSVGFVLGNCGL